MNNKKTLAIVTAGTVMSLFAAVPVPQVSNVGMTQNSQGVATITYGLSDADAVVTLDIQTNATGGAWVSIGGTAVSSARGDVWKKVGIGSHAIKWSGANGGWANGKIPSNGIRAVVTAWTLDNTPEYMAVDISGGAEPGTQKYYPAADFVPGGVTNDEYKTSTLLMRKIMAKGVEWTMGSTGAETQRSGTASREVTHRVTLTNNYYIGVYEVTQSQWYEIAGYNNSNFTTERSMRPVDNVCYNEIRLKSNSTEEATAAEIADYSWPKSPYEVSFLGILRRKTGIEDFDLPSEAQWEFAARAGHGAGYWGDGSAILNANPDENLNALGRYQCDGGQVSNGNGYADPPSNCGVANGTAIVGSYAPNDWGLYDMHGNVWELCLDWYQETLAEMKDIHGVDYGGRVNIDPSNPANFLSGTSAQAASRVRRGACWSSTSAGCRSAYRGPCGSNDRGKNGLRVLCIAGLE